MIIDGFVHQIPDADPEETGEWVEAFDQIVDVEGEQRARFLMARLVEHARSRNIGVPAGRIDEAVQQAVREVRRKGKKKQG